jgi:2-C-methyl-D-erythritol 4-phosphate cytidylyltransferase
MVCPPERWALLETAAAAKPIRRIDGGATRQQSVANGLAALSPGSSLVAVHDGGRPLIHRDDIDRCVDAAADGRAVALARRVTETLKRADAAGRCVASVARDDLWLMETPQVFDTALLRNAYAEVASRQLTVTDEVSAVQAIGVPVQFIESTHPNPKITCPADLVLAAALLTHP